MKLALIYTALGILCGIMVGISRHIVFIFKNNSIMRILCDFITTLSIWCVFSYLNHLFFYGEIKLYLSVFFAIGIWAERKTFGKIFAKLFLMLYNWVIKGLIRFKSTTLGKFITK